jgi:hypothetical protein
VYSIAGFAAALLPMVLWLAAHPEAARSLLLQYNRADPGSATWMETLKNDGVGSAVAETIRIYWSYFDPSFLFVQGGNARNLSTGETGVFLYAVAVLAPLGLYYLRDHPLARLLIVIGLLAAPLPAVAKGAPYAIQRASGLLIHVSLLAGAGLGYAASSKRMRARATAVVLVIFMVCNLRVYRDYHSRYRLASALAYDSTAFGEAAKLIVANPPGQDGVVYLPLNFHDVGAKWRFYTRKLRRTDLWQRTRYFADTSELGTAAPGSIALLPPSGPNVLAGWSP